MCNCIDIVCIFFVNVDYKKVGTKLAVGLFLIFCLSNVRTYIRNLRRKYFHAFT